MTSKDEILSAIQRTAAENEGVPLGKERFFDATGIRESDWSGRFWARWSDAIREAGFEPQKMNAPLSEEQILWGIAKVVMSLGHFPTAAELRLACSTDRTLPSHNTFRRFRGLTDLREQLLLFSEQHNLVDVFAALGEMPSEGDRRTHAAPPAVEESQEGYVYLLKAGRHFKIGRSVSVDIRKRQLAIQLPTPAEEVHRIRTDDPRGIEAYWHQRFAEKRLNGEWFALSASDVKAFRRRRFM